MNNSHNQDTRPSFDVGMIAQRLTDEIGSGRTADKGLSLNNVLSTGIESRSEGAKEIFQTVCASAESIGRAVYQGAWDSLTKAQQEAFRVTSLAWGEGFGKYNSTATTVSPSTESNMPASSAGEFYLNSGLTEGTEAYDHRELLAAKVATTVINVGSARQDAFGETFYPTIVLPPSEGNIRFSVENTYVMTDFLHTGNGSTGVPTGFGSVSIIDAMVDPRVLRDSSIKVIPIYSTTNAAFSKDVAPFEISGVETGALRFNTDIDLLAISNDNLLNPTQILDSTDQLDHDVRIREVFLKIGNGTKKEIISVKLGLAPGANFANNAARSDSRDLALSFNSKMIPIAGNTKTVDGQPSVVLDYLNNPARADWVVYLDLNLSGYVNLETGNIRVNSAPAQIASVWSTPIGADDNARHTKITDATMLTDLMDHLTTIEIVGWVPDASRTNLNRRTRGILVRTEIHAEQYTIPMGPPISVLTPVVDTETLVDLEAPIKLNRIRNSQNAIRSLLDFGDLLKTYKNSSDIRSPRPDIRGIGRYVMRTHYSEAEIDLLATVDSIRSSDRLDDVNHAILAVVRTMVTSAWLSSGYGPAWQAMGIEGRPVINIGSNTAIGSYMTLAADNRILGDLFDINWVTTNNQEMEDIIIINFSCVDGPECFKSGNFYYIPEIVSTLPKTTNGGQSIQLTVQNRNLHINHAPIQIRIRLKNLNEVLSSKVAVKTDTHVTERT